jgi:hypothetical protein
MPQMLAQEKMERMQVKRIYSSGKCSEKEIMEDLNTIEQVLKARQCTTEDHKQEKSSD